MLDILRDILAVLGGGGIVVIGLSKFFGGVFRDHLKEQERRETELNIELHKSQFASRRTQTDQFLKSQYDVYIELWGSLQSLRFAVDALWQKANRDNIAALAKQLRHVRSQVDNWSLFFENTHLKELNRLLSILEDFEAGKTTLVRIRSKEDIPRYFQHEVEQQIEKNRHYKEEFEQILEEMRVSFKGRLSRIEYEE